MKIPFSCLLLMTAVTGIAAPFIYFSGGGVSETEGTFGFEHTVLDFGDSSQSETLSTRLNLINHSESQIIISKVRLSCGCTTTQKDLVGKILGAGESIKVPVELETGEATGYLLSSIAVVGTSQLGNREDVVASCVVRTRVVPDYMVSPKALDFGVQVPMEKGSRELTFTPMNLESSKIVAAKSTDSVFRAELFNDGNEQKVRVVFTAPSTSESQKLKHSGFIHLDTNSKRIPQIEIPVSARVQIPVQAIPGKLVITSNNQNKSSFVLRPIEGKRCDVVRLKTSSPEIVAETEKVNSESIRIVVSVQQTAFDAKSKQHFIDVDCSVGGRDYLVRVPILFLDLKELK